MKYSIVWSERKTTSTGKNKIEAELKPEGGTESLKGVTIWESFPNFTDIMTGHTIEGDIVIKINGQYTNVTLYPPKVSSSPSGFKPRTGATEEVRAKNIERAQQRKAESIAYFNSVNSAIAMLPYQITTSSHAPDSATKEYLIKWRDWFISEFEKWDNTPF